MLVKEEINTIVRKDFSSDNVQSVWVELRNAKWQKALVGVIYRPQTAVVMLGMALNTKLEMHVRREYG